MHIRFLLFGENDYRRQGGGIHSSINQTAFVSLDKASHTKQFLL